MATARSSSSRKAAEKAARVRHVIALLQKWGIQTLGDFAQLNRQQISTRLGPEAVELWERATGRVLRPLRLISPPESFVESFEFEQEIETIEPLLFILRRFLEQLGLRLGGIYLVARELILRLHFSNKQIYERHFQIPQPTNQVELLFRMLYTHLEDFTSEHPIVAVALEAEPIRPARQQFGLFEMALRDPNQLAETLARLTGLLGAERVGTPVLADTYRPDVFRIEPFAGQLAELSEEKPLTKKTRRAALRRFRPAPPASVRRRRAQPVYLRHREREGEITAQDGPYHASGNWWDESAWQRAEWDLQMQDGAVLRCHESPEGWGVDGIYD